MECIFFAHASCGASKFLRNYEHVGTWLLQSALALRGLAGTQKMFPIHFASCSRTECVTRLCLHVGTILLTVPPKARRLKDAVDQTAVLSGLRGAHSYPRSQSPREFLGCPEASFIQHLVAQSSRHLQVCIGDSILIFIQLLVLHCKPQGRDAACGARSICIIAVKATGAGSTVRTVRGRGGRGVTNSGPSTYGNPAAQAKEPATRDT